MEVKTQRHKIKYATTFQIPEPSYVLRIPHILLELTRPGLKRSVEHRKVTSKIGVHVTEVWLVKL
jgi:hypothetical protein